MGGNHVTAWTLASLEVPSKQVSSFALDFTFFKISGQYQNAARFCVSMYHKQSSCSFPTERLLSSETITAGPSLHASLLALWSSMSHMNGLLSSELQRFPTGPHSSHKPVPTSDESSHIDTAMTLSISTNSAGCSSRCCGKIPDKSNSMRKMFVLVHVGKGCSPPWWGRAGSENDRYECWCSACFLFFPFFESGAPWDADTQIHGESSMLNNICLKMLL